MKSDDEIKNDAGEDDVVFEETVEGEGEAFSKDKIKKLRGELKDAKAKEAEYLTALQRERADFINFKKDETARLSRMKDIAREQFAEELLPVLDAYDLAFSNKEAWEKVEKNWRMGVEYIHQQLLKVLAENGVTPIDAKIGDSLDATLHEAIVTLPTTDASQDHTIASIIQQGYRISDRILRPVRVKVFEIKG